MVKGWSSRHIGEEELARYDDGDRHALSLEMLAETLEQVKLQTGFLVGLIYRLANEAEAIKNDSIKILRNPREIADYMYRNEADCVMFTSPEFMPIVLKDKELGWVKDPDEFADWLMIYWTSETLVVAVP